MVVNGRPSKRLKRRVTADLKDFLTFPSAGDADADADAVPIGVTGGPFRTSVEEFLSKYAILPPPSSLFPHLLTWQILFRVGDITVAGANGGLPAPAIVCLDVVEEDVSRSSYVYCDQCRVVGWSSNPVCCKRYHFIIKADGNSIAGYNKWCPSCADTIHMSDSRCKSCNHVLTAEDVEDWMYHQLEDTTHLLHGVVHSNGFGHLLRVNGRESGSSLLSGRHILDFWDRLCKVLGVRKLSVTDVSKKYGLEFRLLHAVTDAQPWYGIWGYEFGTGSFGLTKDAYEMAVENLSSLPLSTFFSQARKPRTHLQDLIAFYQSLSDHELVNISDLFRYLMTLIHDVHKFPLRVDDPNYTKLKAFDSKVLCAWNSDDIARVEEAMFKVLRAVSGSKWVTWRALRGAVCKVGSPELLDFCLKELKGKQATEGLVVNARCRPESGAMEYRLESETAPLTIHRSRSSLVSSSCTSKEHLLQDLRYLYEALLHPQTVSTHVPQPKKEMVIKWATTILDCKQFVKDYQSERLLLMSKPHAIQLLCEVELVDQYDEHVTNPPRELLVLPADATLSDLKLEASRAFQEVYLIFRRFVAEELVGYGGVDERTQVKLLLGSAEYVKIRGKCLGKSGLSRFRMERGLERWTVDCSCGAKDDDGERMLACDACGIWQHTRCSGIPDPDAVPSKYICYRCRYATQVMKGSTIYKGRIGGSFADVAGMLNHGKSLANADTSLALNF